MEKVYYNVPPVKVDIEGFGSVMMRSNQVHGYAVEQFLRESLPGLFSPDSRENFKPTPEVETPSVLRPFTIQKTQIAETIRCACGKPGNYWGVGLAFPDPLCNSCVKTRLYPKRSYTRILAFILSILLSLVAAYGVSFILTGY